MSRAPILEVRDLRTYFFLSEGTVKAVDGASFEVRERGTLGIVGESGCGKSVAARSILGIVERPGRIVGGAIVLARDETPTSAARRAPGPTVDLARLDPRGRAMRQIRGGEIALIFQEPMTSFSPVHTIGNQMVETIRLHHGASRAIARHRAIEVMRLVGIPRPERRIDEFAFQLSGGLRQRAMIALALSCGPRILIADEPTTALDVTTQAQILDLLRQLQAREGMAIVLITHNLGVVAEMCDEVAVMYLGRVVERGPVDAIFHAPKHPYTRALLRSIPSIRSAVRTRLPTVAGSVPHPHNRPGGCPFHPRCPEFMPGTCDRAEPSLLPASDGHAVSCFLYERPAPALVGSPLASRSPADALATAVSHEPVLSARPPEPVLSARSSEPTRSARASSPAHGGRPEWSPAAARMPGGHAEPSGSPLLDVRNLRKHFPIRRGLLRRVVGQVRAVDDVSFAVDRGETLSLVGESGCGKTTTARCILRALPVTAGQILFRREDGAAVDVATLPRDQLRPLRRQMQMIFQDPFSSLNPRRTLFDIVAEPLVANRQGTHRDRADRVAELLRLVGLRPEYMRRYPHAFSGGQRQRIGIARALALHPSLIVADEPVSALDVSVQAQILNLMLDLQDRLGLTYLFVAHDLSVVKHVSDRVAVMYVGRIVEMAPTEGLFSRPRHPYTEALLSAVPTPDPRLRSGRVVLQGEVADAADAPPGCAFHPRCAYATSVCRVERPPLAAIAPGHLVSCHRATELTLRGVAP